MAARRHVASRAELIGQGFSQSELRSWLRSGRLIPVVHGVYSFGRDIESPEAAWRAALVAVGPGALLTGRSACEVWGMVARSNSIPQSIEIARIAGEAVRFSGLSPAMKNTRITVGRRDLEERELRRKCDLTLTSPTRSLIELAGRSSETELRFAFLEACQLRLFLRGDIEYCFRRTQGRRGAKKLNRLLALWVPELNRIRSVFEGMFLLAWVKRGLKMPLVNVKVEGYEVDCYWPKERLVLELDSEAFHGHELARNRDVIKTQKLEAAGLRVERLTYAEFVENPKAAVAKVAGLLAP